MQDKDGQSRELRGKRSLTADKKGRFVSSGIKKGRCLKKGHGRTKIKELREQRSLTVDDKGGIAPRPEREEVRW